MNPCGPFGGLDVELVEGREVLLVAPDDFDAGLLGLLMLRRHLG